MRNLITRLILFIALFSFGSAPLLHAQQIGLCTPLPAPSNITVAIATPNSATATWSSVVTNAWYQVRLTNLDLNIVVSTNYTQATSITYTNLNSNTRYEVRVSASTCYRGPYGLPALKEFRTPAIIIDDVAMLSPQSLPNQQPNYAPANTPVGQADFFLCLIEKRLDQGFNPLEDVFYAYIYADDNSSDFFEFTLVADTEKRARFPQTTNSVGLWGVQYLNQNNALVPANSPDIVAVRVWHNNSNDPNNHKMRISYEGCFQFQNNGYLAMRIQTLNGAELYHSTNNCYVNLNSPACGNQFQGEPGADRQAEAALDTYVVPALQAVPNPFSEQITLQLQGDDSPIESLIITDVYGKTVSFYNQPGLPADVDLDLRDLSPGLYFIQVKTQNQWYTTTAVKTNRP